MTPQFRDLRSIAIRVRCPSDGRTCTNVSFERGSILQRKLQRSDSGPVHFRHDDEHGTERSNIAEALVKKWSKNRKERNDAKKEIRRHRIKKFHREHSDVDYDDGWFGVSGESQRLSAIEEKEKFASCAHDGERVTLRLWIGLLCEGAELHSRDSEDEGNEEYYADDVENVGGQDEDEDDDFGNYGG